MNGMFDPNMLSLARLAQMNLLLNQAMLQATQNQALQDQPQVFQNVAVPSMAPPPGFEFIPVAQAPTCEQQLANGTRIFQGLASTLSQAIDHIRECEGFVSARSDEPGAQDVDFALLRALSAALMAQDFITPPGAMDTARVLTLGRVEPCEDTLARTTRIIAALVNFIQGPVFDALSLCSTFLLPRTDQPGAQDLLNRERLFMMTTNATILAAARQFLQGVPMF